MHRMPLIRNKLTAAQTQMERRMLIEHNIPRQKKKNIWVMEMTKVVDVIACTLPFCLFRLFRISANFANGIDVVF